MILREQEDHIYLLLNPDQIMILEIKAKYIDDKIVFETEIDPQKQRIELLERNNLDQEKTDMWDA